MQNAVHTKLPVRQTVPEPLEYGWLEEQENYSGITESAVWRNAGSIAYQLQETVVETEVDTFLFTYVVVFCIKLYTNFLNAPRNSIDFRLPICNWRNITKLRSR